jgi:pimeloyl-ACP methyl ester carboxylesterase
MMISPTLDVDWELRETGPAEARHGVLLLPGGACSAAFYNELTAEPALAGLRLVAATLPGHAGTPAPSDLSTQNYGRLAAQLAAVKHCDTVLGFSMGSTVALEMATTAGFTGPLILTGASFSRKAESTMLEVLDAPVRVHAVDVWPDAQAEQNPGATASGAAGRIQAQSAERTAQTYKGLSA